MTKAFALPSGVHIDVDREWPDNVAHDPEDIGRIVAGEQPFFCHQGIRRPRVWRHPSGIEVPSDPANYCPPMVEGVPVPYKADGTPAGICAGWAARKAEAS